MDTVDGFVYIWFDTKRKMFYIGSHVGSTTDGYIASSKRLVRAVRARPDSCKRRILCHVAGSRKELLAEETRWLQMIKVEELGAKFYNLKRVATGGNLMESKTATEKDEWRKKIANGGKLAWSKASKARRELAAATAFGGNKFDRGYLKTQDYRDKMRFACTDEKNGFHGKTHSADSCNQMSQSRTGNANRARNFIFTSPNGVEHHVKNLQKFLRGHGGRVKLTRFLQNADPIQLRNKPDHALTGWRVRYA